MLGHPAGLVERPPEEHLYLRVQTAELVVCPARQRIMDRGVDPEEYLTTVGHVYKDPVLTTADGGWSPQSTTSRLLTMLALRSSSSSTTSF
jgi:hypothetical protein